MTKHLTGSKRLAIIQRWINGHDDPNWEVLPTRKEGKYIVKKRTDPIEVEKVEETPEEENSEEEKVEETPPKPQKVAKTPKPPKPQVYDPTINLEILNQLKLLGEEIRNKREKKEQKRMIKEVINKQMNKPRYVYQQAQEEQPEPEPEPLQMPINRRSRIFEDMY